MTTQEVPQQSAAPQPTPSRGARPLLLGLGIAFGVLSIAAGALNVMGSIGRETVRRHATYQGVRVVDIDVAAESVQVVAGPDDVTRLDRSISWSLGKPAFSQQQQGDRLVIRSSCGLDLGYGCSGTVHVVVPAATEVIAHSSAGSVGVTAVAGRLHLSSSAGNVDAVRLPSTDVQADSSAGSVHLSFTVAPARVKATSSAGSVQVLVPSGQESYLVSADSSAGSTDVSVRTDPSSSRTIEAHSSGGSVHVGYSG
jgi:hypothetical protein